MVDACGERREVRPSVAGGGGGFDRTRVRVRRRRTVQRAARAMSARSSRGPRPRRDPREYPPTSARAGRGRGAPSDWDEGRRRDWDPGSGDRDSIALRRNASARLASSWLRHVASAICAASSSSAGRGRRASSESSGRRRPVEGAPPVPARVPCGWVPGEGCLDTGRVPGLRGAPRLEDARARRSSEPWSSSVHEPSDEARVDDLGCRAASRAPATRYSPSRLGPFVGRPLPRAVSYLAGCGPRAARTRRGAPRIASSRVWRVRRMVRSSDDADARACGLRAGRPRRGGSLRLLARRLAHHASPPVGRVPRGWSNVSEKNVGTGGFVRESRGAARRSWIRAGFERSSRARRRRALSRRRSLHLVLPRRRATPRRVPRSPRVSLLTSDLARRPRHEERSRGADSRDHLVAHDRRGSNRDAFTSLRC